VLSLVELEVELLCYATTVLSAITTCMLLEKLSYPTKLVPFTFMSNLLTAVTPIVPLYEPPAELVQQLTDERGAREVASTIE